MPQLTSVEAIDAKVAWARPIGAVAALLVVNLVATLLLIAIGRTRQQSLRVPLWAGSLA